MITGKETNKIFFSSLLPELFPGPWSRIKRVLEKAAVSYSLLHGTNDIWCRDYMPVQQDRNRFLQFRYDPGYLKDDPELRSDPEQVHKANKIHADFSKINLDGGNVVRWKDKLL